MFDASSKKVKSWYQSPLAPLTVIHVGAEEWCYASFQMIQNPNNSFLQKNHLFVCNDVDQAEQLYEFYQGLPELTAQGFELLFFPGIEGALYTGRFGPEKELYQKIYSLSSLVFSKRNKIVFTTMEAFFLKIPPPSFFSEHTIALEISDVISPQELSQKMVYAGYTHSNSVDEPGTFSKRGEIFDIYPTNHDPIRIHYFDDMIEEIFLIDRDTQKTLRNKTIEKLNIAPGPGLFVLEHKFISQFKSNIPMPPANFKERYQLRKSVFNSISSGQLFDNYTYCLPLFFSETALLRDYISKDSIIHFLDQSKSMQNQIELFEQLRNDYDERQADVESDSIFPAPSFFYEEDIQKVENGLNRIYINSLDVELDLNFNANIENSLDLNLKNSRVFLMEKVHPTGNKINDVRNILTFLTNEFEIKGSLYINYKSQSAKDEIEFLFREVGASETFISKIKFSPLALKNGFYYPTEDTLVLSDSDLFGQKKVATKTTKKNVDLFAEQISTLKNGDFVVHSTFGIGRYQGLTSLKVLENDADFIVIEYDGQDKVYVPVYKMNMVQKHADAAATVKLANLNSNKFKEIRERAKESAKKLAFDLLKLQALRESSEAFSFSPPDHIFQEFELGFPFKETPDQSRAILDVLEDMQKLRPMDRLICGDVGFGKTEVAMRASFKAVLDKKQVAILVPTTILALQHYNSFIKRFSDFPVEIDFISRFKSATESKVVLEKVAQGKVDILIGTHRLLSNDIKFKDLGLVVIDEEQRFGVNHKEKLKSLRSTVDFLTLTATPIPRTLQLAFLGLRDLSLIQTSPPKRQSIKTFIIKEDEATIQVAIEKELKRGGQVFFVHNRVMDIEDISARIKRLVPQAKIIVAHGQLSEKELEKRIALFYKGQYQILICTTIIESGIDVPNANTMIIDRADCFGLAQLHQLRGRIGRSDRKAYAYFVVPKTHKLSEVSAKRLKALQTYADMGAGFSIASSDLEIRGAGDILGAEQSGHIESVGLELYMELLKEAILELKNEKTQQLIETEITCTGPSFIPKNYIEDAPSRLKYYKKLSNCSDINFLKSIENEIEDIYGPIPHELNNLFIILEIRLILGPLAVKLVKAANFIVTLKFDQSSLDKNDVLKNKIIDFFMARPKVYQITPDYSVRCSLKEKINHQTLLEFAKEIAQKITP